MSTRADVILDDFGKSVGIPDMKFDENHLCSFKVDDKFNVSILSKSDESLFFYGMVGKITLDHEAVFSVLLSANLYLAEANLPILAYEPKSSVLVLAKSFSIDGLDAVSVESIIDTLSEQMRTIECNLLEELNVRLSEVE